MNDNIVEELDLLLNNFWILKKNREQDYYKIKNKLKILRDFANNKLGCDIICNSKLIKLEKLPIQDEQTYKIEAFDNSLDYVLFTILLLFLEDKGIDEQFVLSNFTEYVTNVLATITGDVKPDWKRFKDRKSLVDVLKYAEGEGIICLKDGNDAMYADDETTEALYENTALSHYVMRNFKFDVFSCNCPQDFIESEKIELDSINRKRFWAYRGLFFYPSMILDENDNEVIQYLKNMRGRIGEDVNKYLEGEFILCRNMAFVSLNGTREKDLFPNYRKTISDIILLINGYLRDYQNNLVNDKIIMPKTEFFRLLEKVHKENCSYFSKEYREAPIYKFEELIRKYMLDYKLLKVTEDNYIIYPIAFLISGKYRKKEENTKEENNYEILSLDLEE